MRPVQDGEGLPLPELHAVLQRAQEPRAARDARVRPRSAVQVSVLLVQQASPERAQETHGQEAPRPRPRARRAERLALVASLRRNIPT